MLVGLLITNVCFFIISCFKLEVNLFLCCGVLDILVFFCGVCWGLVLLFFSLLRVLLSHLFFGFHFS